MKDESKFAQIVKENKATIYTVCYMFSQDKDEVQDLFQDTLVNLWNGFEDFRGDSKTETWVWRVALNTCISAERKKKSQGEKVPLSLDIDLYSDSDAASLQVQLLHKRIGKLGRPLLWRCQDRSQRLCPSEAHVPHLDHPFRPSSHLSLAGMGMLRISGSPAIRHRTALDHLHHHSRSRSYRIPHRISHALQGGRCLPRSD